ncbi:hypothetical protein BDP27DRAFT_1425862 [Rhodocollybia butyracea]|uniref:Uncharacterized protein n=1 Tax=Rhodocollybia butyracea TaxID=206335 RepID=A0A9P5PLV3_9AGAR|nr:hypothetical protein BDP27DRAFT_1425862 [Rhodocollybia butyracea]
MASMIVCTSATSPPLHNTMGALLIGVLISAVLWGILVVQTYIYFATFFNQDTVQLKSFVFFVFILDTAHQAMLCHLIYVYLVSNYGNTEYLGIEHIGNGASLGNYCYGHPTLHVLADLDTEPQECSTVYFPQILIVVASFTVTMVYFGKSWYLRTWVELAKLSVISRAVNGLNFGGDMAITFALVYLLGTLKSGIKRTNAFLNHLMLQTGLLTTYVVSLLLSYHAKLAC